MGYDIPHVLAATWSLAIEEHFYLILPALIAITTRSQLAAAIAGFVVLAFLLRSGMSTRRLVSQNTKTAQKKAADNRAGRSGETATVLILPSIIAKATR
jgi:peptidoglycan/LPS O-acetylase OafA/YrhL